MRKLLNSCQALRTRAQTPVLCVSTYACIFGASICTRTIRSRTLAYDLVSCKITEAHYQSLNGAKVISSSARHRRSVMIKYWLQRPLEILWLTAHVKDTRIGSPDVDVAAVCIQPLVRLTVHDVERTPWGATRELLGAEDTPLSLIACSMVRAAAGAPAPQFHVGEVAVAEGGKVLVRPLFSDIEPVRIVRRGLEAPKRMRALVRVDVDILVRRAQVPFVHRVVDVENWRRIHYSRKQFTNVAWGIRRTRCTLTARVHGQGYVHVATCVCRHEVPTRTTSKRRSVLAFALVLGRRVRASAAQIATAHRYHDGHFARIRAAALVWLRPSATHAALD